MQPGDGESHLSTKIQDVQLSARPPVREGSAGTWRLTCSRSFLGHLRWRNSGVQQHYASPGQANYALSRVSEGAVIKASSVRGEGGIRVSETTIEVATPKQARVTPHAGREETRSKREDREVANGECSVLAGWATVASKGGFTRGRYRQENRAREEARARGSNWGEQGE